MIGFHGAGPTRRGFGRCWVIIRSASTSSTRARFAPRQWCTPPPKVRMAGGLCSRSLVCVKAPVELLDDSFHHRIGAQHESQILELTEDREQLVAFRDSPNSLLLDGVEGQ